MELCKCAVYEHLQGKNECTKCGLPITEDSCQCGNPIDIDDFGIFCCNECFRNIDTQKHHDIMAENDNFLFGYEDK